jgi:hypothetical protein
MIVHSRIFSGIALVLICACGRDVPSGLDVVADSVAASTPIVPDTARSSAIGARRLAVVREVLLAETADTTSPYFIRGAGRMALSPAGFAIFASGNLNYFDNRGSHVWSTSRYDFAPGQAQNAKRSAFGGGGAADPGDWIEWMLDKNSFAPGAITSVARMEWSGDTLAILQGSAEVQLYTRAGRSVSMLRLGRRERAGQVTSFGRSPAGWMAVVNAGQPRTPGDRVSDTIVHQLRRVSLRNGEIGPVLRSWKTARPYLQMQYGSRERRQSTYVYPLVRAIPFQEIGAGRWYTTMGQDLQFDVYDEYGRLARVIIVDSERTPVTEKLLDSLAEGTARRYRELAARGESSAAAWLNEIKPRQRALPVPSHRPVVAAAWIGDDGSIAVRRADIGGQAAGDSLLIDVIGSDGRYRGRVALPRAGVTVTHFTGGAFHVAEKAGTIVLTEIDTAQRAQTYTDAGRVVLARDGRTAEYEYQRLVRYVIR